MNANRLVSLVFGLLAVGVIALGWLLGVAPKLAEASRADTERASVQAQNAAHEARLAELEADFARIGQLRAELGELQRFVPADHQLEDFLDALDGYLEDTGAALISVSFGEPSVLGEPGAGPALIGIPLTLAAEATLAQALELTEAIQLTERVVVTSSMTFDDSGVQLAGWLYVVAEVGEPAP